ncbi:MAG TPA: hypothetical protein VKT32_01915 [Chthonomonadaceae bacterium]|nr:hypothetical protein [Chthonomonadaceae bacterium]
MRQLTKKDLALSLRAAGRTVEEIAQALQCSPSYVANVLIAAGRPTDYSDLYTSSSAQNAYARTFNGVLRFKNIEAARESVARIDALFHHYAATHDRRGQHQAQLMALIGKNRAEGIGKLEEAKIFADWLVTHLDTAHAPACELGPAPAGSPDEEGSLADPDYSQMSPYEATLAFS